MMIQTRIAGFQLRIATEKDAELLHYFIRELAIYEQLEQDLTGTPEDIKDNLFAKNFGEAMIAYYNGIEVGFCLYFTNFSTFTCKGVMYLEDLFIKEEYRNLGFGKEIFYQLALLAQQRDYTRFEWVCLDWNEPSIKFYEEVIGAKGLREWLRFRMDQKAIDSLVKKDFSR